MAATKIIIAGGGIAGPVLGMLLKRKGYDPVLYERTDSVSTAGLSLAYAPLFYDRPVANILLQPSA